jgi:hypothetical protein
MPKAEVMHRVTNRIGFVVRTLQQVLEITRRALFSDCCLLTAIPALGPSSLSPVNTRGPLAGRDACKIGQTGVHSLLIYCPSMDEASRLISPAGSPNVSQLVTQQYGIILQQRVRSHDANFSL